MKFVLQQFWKDFVQNRGHINQKNLLVLGGGTPPLPFPVAVKWQQELSLGGKILLLFLFLLVESKSTGGEDIQPST